MLRYKLTIAYDGTDFCGWQKQHPPAAAHPDLPSFEPDDDDEVAGGDAAPTPDGPMVPTRMTRRKNPGPRVALRTVQQVVEDTLRDLLREKVRLTGSSRTDAGVHAGGSCPDGSPGGQVAVFDSNPIPEKGVGWPKDRGFDTLKLALNARLPADVVVRTVDRAHPNLDVIGGVETKGYSYTIDLGPERPLWDRRYVFWDRHPFAPGWVERMQAAAGDFVGEHDVVAFAQINHGRKTTVRTIHRCSVTPIGEHRARIDVEGSGFLYNQIRIMAGTLLEVGRAKREGFDEGCVPRIIASRDRKLAGPTLPPEGLRLEWIRHGDPRTGGADRTD